MPNIKWCLVSENFTVVKRISKLIIWSFKNEGLSDIQSGLKLDKEIRTNLDK